MTNAIAKTSVRFVVWTRFMTTEMKPPIASINHEHMPVLILDPADDEIRTGPEAFGWRSVTQPSRCASFNRLPIAMTCWCWSPGRNKQPPRLGASALSDPE